MNQPNVSGPPYTDPEGRNMDISHTQDIDVILDDDYFESVARSALEKALRDERIPAAQRTRRTRLLLEKFHSTRTA